MDIRITTRPMFGITFAENLEVNGTSAMAICHPDDTFDEAIGIRLAIQRLLEGIRPGDNVVLEKHQFPSCASPGMAKYIISYCVVRLGVLPGSFLDKIDQNPLVEKNGRPVQYRFIYETADRWAIIENKLTGKIAVTMLHNLIRA